MWVVQKQHAEEVDPASIVFERNDRDVSWRSSLKEKTAAAKTIRLNSTALLTLSLDHPLTIMLKSVPWGLRSRALALFTGARRSASELRPLIEDLSRRVSVVEDEITVKLFKLMYETVKQCNAKVQRAEAIRFYYANDSRAFDTGYMFGDITDKFSTMKDIAATLKRLYNQWTPIEHVNAYEQIANQAIELNHLIDILKSVYQLRNDNMAQIHT